MILHRRDRGGSAHPVEARWLWRGVRGGRSAFQAKGGRRHSARPSQHLAYASLALGSALARLHVSAYLDGHPREPERQYDPQERGAAAGYTLPARPESPLLATWATRRHLKIASPTDVVPALFQSLFPGWFAGFCLRRDRIGALVPAAV